MRVVEKAPLTIVGERVVADWDGLWSTMPAAWERFRARATEIRNRAGDVFVDVCVDRVGELYTQLIGAEVTEAGPVPAGMDVMEVPAQLYVHLRHIGPLSGIAASFGRMYAWAAEHGHPVDHFKLDFGYTEAGDEVEHDLYVRILSDPDRVVSPNPT